MSRRCPEHGHCGGWEGAAAEAEVLVAKVRQRQATEKLLAAYARRDRSRAELDRHRRRLEQKAFAIAGSRAPAELSRSERKAIAQLVVQHEAVLERIHTRRRPFRYRRPTGPRMSVPVMAPRRPLVLSRARERCDTRSRHNSRSATRGPPGSDSDPPEPPGFWPPFLDEDGAA